MKLSSRLVGLVLLFLVSAVLVEVLGCKPLETPLPFETLAHGNARLIDSQGMAYGSSYDKMDLLSKLQKVL